MTRSEAKQRLRSDRALIGTMFLEVPSPGTCRMIQEAGYDFVIFDTEHSWYGVETIAQFIRCARDIGLLVIVRAPAFQGNWPARYLDLGADGMVFPHVDTAEQAADIIRQVKYPPVGERGMANGIAHDEYAAKPMTAFTTAANEDIIVIVQIETAAGLQSRDGILATPGVDAVFIGPNDLSLSMGYPGQLDRPEVVQAMADILASAREHGVAPGLHGFSVEATLNWLERGARFVCHRADISLIVQGSQQDLAVLRQHPAAS
jgi:2-keto-3-deoxy-L-rhamnonate aldolase RhmA